MKYSETWGDVVWRHNMLCVLTCVGIVAAVVGVTCLGAWWTP